MRACASVHIFAALATGLLLTLETPRAAGQQAIEGLRAGNVPPLPVEYLQVQGLRRAVRFYQPERLADRPAEFTALAVVGANLPVPEENGCDLADEAVSMFLVSGTADPVNPWAGGEVRIPGGGSPGHVLSADASAEYFRKLARAPKDPLVKIYPDRDTTDGAMVETRRWAGHAGAEVVLMTVRGGGHTLPYPSAKFPSAVVGATCRDLDGPSVIWEFFERRLEQR